MKKLFAAAGVFFCLSTFAQAMSFSNNGQEIRFRVLSYNVWGAPISGKRAKDRIPRIGKTIPVLDADVVGIQEAFEGCMVKNQPKMILKGVQFPYFTRGKAPKGNRCLSSGVLILSRFPILAADSMVYRKCAGLDCLSRKGVAYARIVVPYIGEVDIYATHANAGDKHGKTRWEQTAEMIQFIEKNSGDGDRPMFFMGDFNAVPGAPEIERLQRELILKDSHAEYVAGRDLPPVERDGFTVDPKRNPNTSQSSENKPKRLDYIFHRESRAQPNAIRVALSKLVFNTKDYLDRPLSDHFGVMSDFHIQTSRLAH